MEDGAGASWRQQCGNMVGPRDLMAPQRSVILDTELREHARGEPVRIPLTGQGKLNAPPTRQVRLLELPCPWNAQAWRTRLQTPCAWLGARARKRKYGK